MRQVVQRASRERLWLGWSPCPGMVPQGPGAWEEEGRVDRRGGLLRLAAGGLGWLCDRGRRSQGVAGEPDRGTGKSRSVMTAA